MRSLSAAQLVAASLLVLARPALPDDCICPGGPPPQFQLSHLGSTTLQIALAWDRVPAATGYTLERSMTCDSSPPPSAHDETGVSDGAYVGGITPGVPGALPGDSNTAVAFDGVSGHINAGNDDSLNFIYRTSGLTLEAWVKPAGFSDYNAMIGKVDNLTAQANYALDFNGSTVVRYYTGNGAWNTQTWNVAVSLTTWNHLVLTHETNGTVTLWINGVSQGQRLNTSTPSLAAVPVGIGNQLGSSVSWPFNGSLDEVAIYDRALPAGRIQAHYSAATSGGYATQVLSDTPISYWRLGEPAGAVVDLFQLSNAATAYGDTGRAPDDKCRFHGDNSCPIPPGRPLLEQGREYFYRLKAQLPGGAELVSNCEKASLVSAPTRGVVGDLWADVVLGQPNFGENALLKTTAQGTNRPGGVLIDKSGAPNRVFLADIVNNRVLGFDHLGTCVGGGPACTTHSDCGTGTCVFDATPAVVFGQPGFVDHGACNGDGTAQLFPARTAANASSLCLIPPLQITIPEVIHGTLMDVDASGALYVPDTFNNRVLKYGDPFVDQVADQVWGQADFGGNACNRGGSAGPETLCLSSGTDHAGVALDGAGNLWVADTGNARVLRYPKSGSSIAAQADYVFGQASCMSTGRRAFGAPDLDGLRYPYDVAYDRAHDILYIADSDDTAGHSRILRIQLPVGLPPRGSCTQLSYPTSEVPLVTPCGTDPVEVRMDTQTSNLWVRYSMRCTELLDVTTGVATLTTRQADGPYADLRGMDVDSDGNLFLVDAFYGLYRLDRRDLEVGSRGSQRIVAGSDEAGGGFTADAMINPFGVAVFRDPSGAGGDQLIVADQHRILIWNHYDLATLTDGAPADDLFGTSSFSSATLLSAQFFAYPQVNNGKLWVYRQRFGARELLIFDYPLRNASVPVRTLNLAAPYPVLGGGSATTTGGPIDFSVDGSGNAVWVADRDNSRVLRINDINGRPYVDVVLGQPDSVSTYCNRSSDPQAAPAANTLCVPYDVTLDANGNLYVGDNGGETGTNKRLVGFDESQFSVASQALFGLPATRAFGTGGSLSLNGFFSPVDPFISPFKPVFFPQGYLVVGNNPYDHTQRFPTVYLNPLREQLPQLVLGDFSSYPAGGHYVDKAGNLYFSDTNWARVLIYKRPFRGIDAPCSPSPLRPCRSAGLSRISIRDAAADTRDSISWTWLRGPLVTVPDFGDPENSTSYALCLYDSRAGSPALVATMKAPQAGMCDGRPCWRPVGVNGFTYKTRDHAPDGLAKLLLKAGAAGRSRVTAKGSGSPLPGFGLPLTPPVTLQLVSSDGECWGADYESPSRVNDGIDFKDSAP